jgi:hypothetical protein
MAKSKKKEEKSLAVGMPPGGIWIGNRKITPDMFTCPNCVQRYLDAYPQLARYFPDHNIDLTAQKKSQETPVTVDADPPDEKDVSEDS